MHSDAGSVSQSLTLILAGGQGKRLSPFTAKRAKPLVSFGGAFRIIDFTLSNCVNSGLERVYLLTQYKAELMRQYVESSLWKTDFVCLPPRTLSGYRGTADSVYQNLDLLRRQKADHVLILAADHVYRMDYRRLLRFHASHGGDVTIAAVRYPRQLAGELGILEVDEDARVVGFREKPGQLETLQSDSSSVLVNMGVYVFNVPTLLQTLLRDAGKFGSGHELGRDVLPNLVGAVRVHAYDFTTNDDGLGNYWCDVGTIDSLHRAQMDLLAEHKPFDLCSDNLWPIYAAGASVFSRDMTADSLWSVDSIISPDSKVFGANIVRSVISPQVEIAPEAEIRNSVLMRGVRIGRGARIRRAIVDEGVRIPDGERIGFDPAEDRQRFLITTNGVVVVQAANLAKFHKESA